MPERNFRTRVDRYFRKEDTLLAKGLQKLSPQTGDEYRRGTTKRLAESLIVAAVSPLAIALGGLSAFAVKMEDGGPMFYRDRRFGKDGKMFDLIKIRYMKQGANQELWQDTHDRNSRKAKDPRNTRVGNYLTEAEIEELPQLAQVLSGEMSLVDVRAVAPYARDHMQRNMNSDKFNRWDEARAKGKPGIFSLNSAIKIV